ncbi:hypothetical protein KI387_033107, partial [Taxus chinensis]
FTASPLGDAPTRPKHLPKGKGKDIEGEANTTQKEVPKSPPSTTKEQVVDLVSLRREEAASAPMDTSTQDVVTTKT